MPSTSLTRFAWLSIAAAVITIGLKATAYVLTGSVGLLSDALESAVNLVVAMMALAMLTFAARPMRNMPMATVRRSILPAVSRARSSSSRRLVSVGPPGLACSTHSRLRRRAWGLASPLAHR